MKNIDRATVIGTGLVGTSVALALRKGGIEVRLRDHNPHAVEEAVLLGAGQPLTAADPPADLVVLAVPPAAVARVLHDAQRAGLGRYFTDVASVKAPVVAAAAAYGCDLAGFVPGHPMAGGEQAGPGAARADLFLGRTWALCPTPEVSPEALATVRAAAELAGAVPYELPPECHDRAVAVVSHLPHVVSSAVAARLAEADSSALRLAGAGVRDVTRVAAGDVPLWLDILGHNAAPVADAIEALVDDLRGAAAALRAGAGNPAERAHAVASLLRRGNDGRRRLIAELG